MEKTKLMAAMLALSTLALPAAAQSHDEHMEHAAPSAGSAASDAYREANQRMHEDMMLESTGDADVDFVRGMIIHHEGALEMARIVLEHGEDPEIRKLAEAIVAAQDEEIAFMQAWLAAKASSATAEPESIESD